MAESNLPSGLATKDLPGNSSKDMAWERLWDNWSVEFGGIPDRLRIIATDWEKKCESYTVEKKKLEAFSIEGLA